MITDAQFAELKESVDKIHAALPALFAFRDNFELWAKETGVFDHLVQDVLSRVPKSVVQEPCTTPAPVPSVTNSGTIPGLSGTQIAEIQKAFAASPRQVWAPQFAAINLDLSKGVYDYGNPQKIEATKEVFYDDRSFTALKAYLDIIDQRIQLPTGGNSDDTLPVDSPLWKRVGDSLPVSSAIPGTGNPNGSVTLGDGEGEIVHRSNLNHSPRQSGLTCSGVGRTDINGWDFGYRSKQNYQHEGTPELPYMIYGGNSHATFEYSWFPAAVDDGSGGDFGTSAIQTDPTHPLFRWYRGQGFVVDQGAQPVTEYGTGNVLSTKRHLMIGTQRERWPLMLVVSPIRPSASGKVEEGLPVNWCVAMCDADGGANPWQFVVGGRLRRLIVDSNGQPAFL